MKVEFKEVAREDCFFISLLSNLDNVITITSEFEIEVTTEVVSLCDDKREEEELCRTTSIGVMLLTFIVSENVRIIKY